MRMDEQQSKMESQTQLQLHLQHPSHSERSTPTLLKSTLLNPSLLTESECVTQSDALINIDDQLFPTCQPVGVDATPAQLSGQEGSSLSLSLSSVALSSPASKSPMDEPAQPDLNGHNSGQSLSDTNANEANDEDDHEQIILVSDDNRHSPITSRDSHLNGTSDLMIGKIDQTLLNGIMEKVGSSLIGDHVAHDSIGREANLIEQQQQQQQPDSAIILGSGQLQRNQDTFGLSNRIMGPDTSGRHQGNGLSDDDVDDDELDDELDDVDDDDDSVNNMLSGSSQSSAATMPLLTESHSHHNPFERISLEEYSPLSLVDADCDNALDTISPSSLHHLHHHHHHHHHPFKNSLNNLKMEGLDGVGVEADEDVVGDGRSISPSLLSSAAVGGAGGGVTEPGPMGTNLWSNSSTAITQNPVLLTGSSSSSFLLSHHHHNHHHHHHHHHHQLNTLMQQLEPQSLDDEPPPLSSQASAGSLADHQPNGHHQHNQQQQQQQQQQQNQQQHQHLLCHRPSSEPLPSCGFETAPNGASSNDGIGCLLLNHLDAKLTTTTLGNWGQQASTMQLGSPTNKTASNTRMSAPSSGQSNSMSGRLSSSKQSEASSSSGSGGGAGRDCSKSTAVGGPKPARSGRSRATSTVSSSKQQTKAGAGNKANGKCKAVTHPAYATESRHSSQMHLQLNHHEKLKELQQRLFGTSPAPAPVAAQKSPGTDKGHLEQPAEAVGNHSDGSPLKRSAPAKSERSPGKAAAAKGQAEAVIVQEAVSLVPSGVGTKTRSRSSSRRRTKTMKMGHTTTSGTSVSDSSPSSTDQQQQQQQQQRNSMMPTSTSASQQKVVVTETAEPDTTTKSSDCIKLADLLASANSTDSTVKLVANLSELVQSKGLEMGACGASIGAIGLKNSLNNNNSVDRSCSPAKGQTGTGNSDSEKRVQHFQFQVGSSLAVLSNGDMLQPIEIQHAQGPAQRTISATNNAASIQVCAPGGIGLAHHENQLLCRPITVMTSMGPATVSASVAGQELLQGSETALIANWPTQEQSQGNGSALALGMSNNSNAGSGPGMATLTNANANTPTSISAHQIAIQVICQDGTSLVLPVSSNLNAVSLAPQQLQALLGTAATVSANPSHIQQLQQHQQQRKGIAPALVSVANIIAQEQTNAGKELNGMITTHPSMAGAQLLQNNPAGHTSQSHLAASSPTLAALLDANTVRMGNCLNVASVGASTSSNSSCGPSIDANGQSNPQRIVSTNLLKKLIGSTELNSSDRLKEEALPGSSCSPSLQQQLLSTTLDNNATSDANLESGTSSDGTAESSDSASGSKPGRSASSTGNRQVDPAQPFRCEHCNSTFTRLGNFTRHKKIHTVPIKDGQRFKCDVCSKSFLQRCDLARHLHIHRGTEPHRCNICGKGYIRHSDLVTHQRFHNKEKPFGCPHCSKGFCQRGDLNRHLRSIHLQMKPILCPCCNRKFAKQETLLRHLNTAHRIRQTTV